MQVFYLPNISGKFTILSETESKHCIKVLRYSLSDIIHLIDGKGGLYKARIIEANPHSCKLEIIEYQPDYHKRNSKLHIAIAPPKQTDRFEWFIEKAVEIGVDEITPIHCKHSERKEIKIERLEKLIITAMKQAIVSEKPVLNEMITFRQLIKTLSTVDSDKFIAHYTDASQKPLREALTRSNNAIVLIGPEGDFTPEEIETALKEGIYPVSLGKNRLRTETAALSACLIFNQINY